MYKNLLFYCFYSLVFQILISLSGARRFAEATGANTGEATPFIRKIRRPRRPRSVVRTTAEPNPCRMSVKYAGFVVLWAVLMSCLSWTGWQL